MSQHGCGEDVPLTPGEARTLEVIQGFRNQLERMQLALRVERQKNATLRGLASVGQLADGDDGDTFDCRACGYEIVIPCPFCRSGGEATDGP